MIQGLRFVVGLMMLMVDLEAVDLVALVVVIGLEGPTEVELVLIVDMVEVNLVAMEDTELGVLVLTGESLPWDILVVMEDCTAEVMI
jgi:hypothetical protein